MNERGWLMDQATDWIPDCRPSGLNTEVLLQANEAGNM